MEVIPPIGNSVGFTSTRGAARSCHRPLAEGWFQGHQTQKKERPKRPGNWCLNGPKMTCVGKGDREGPQESKNGKKNEETI